MSVCEFKGVGYAGSAPYPVTAAPAVFDTKAMLASLPSKGSKKKKMLLRVSPAEVTLVDSKSLESKVRVPAPLITWAKHDEELHCIVIMDTYATPPQCHFIISKQHAETVFRHIMHRLGVQTRMDRAQQNPQEHTAVKERDVCEEDFPQSFEARFLGSLTVTGRPGAHVVKESLQFIKRQLKKHEQDSDAGSGRRVQGNNVAVIVSLEGLRALDVLTRATITSLLIASITYLDTVQDEEEGEILAIIAYDDRLDRHNLQLFQCADGQTQDLIKLLEFASVQHQTVASKEAFNPFVPEEGHDIQSLDDFKVSPRLLAKSLPRECLAPVKPLESGQYGKYYLATFTQVDAQHDQQFGLFSANGAGDGDDDGDGGMTAHAAGSSPHLAVYVIQSDVSQTERAQMLSGYEVLAEMQHPNIVSLFGVSITQQPWLLACEFAPYGSIADVIKTCQEKSVEVHVYDRLHLAHQLASALEHLHARRCVHTDVQASNCLLTYGGRLKLSGFVNAHRYDPKERGYTLRSRTKLALRWLAVETFTRSPRVFSEASDVWAFGVTTWEIFTGLVPYHDMRLTEVHQEVPKGLRPPRPPGCHDSLWTLLTTTWSADSTIRPTFAVIRDRLAREMDAFPDQELHDIGKMVNDKLHAKIETLSRNATERHRKRSRRSSRDSSESSLSGPSFGNVSRTNPVFGQRLDAIWELDLSDVHYDEADGSDDDDGDGDEGGDGDDDEGDDGGGRGVVIRNTDVGDGGGLDGGRKRAPPPPPPRPKPRPPLVTAGDQYRRRSATLPTSPPPPPPSSVGVNGAPVPRARNSPAAAKSTITVGGAKPQHVILMPQEDQPNLTDTQRHRNRAERIALLSRNPSRRDLEINPDMFIPDEYF